MADLRKSLKRSSAVHAKDDAPKSSEGHHSEGGKSVLANKLSILALQIGYMG
jgi:hypothetical protein